VLSDLARRSTRSDGMALLARPARFAAPVALLALAGALLSACGDDGGSPPAASPSSASLPQTAPDPDERCPIDVPAEPVVLTTETGLPLAAARYGSGHHAVVLVHQRGSDLCGWSEQVPDLVALGLQVLAIDLRCHGYSECPADDAGDDLSRDYAADVGAAVADLDRTGAAKVGVMGASLGAAAAFVAAGRYPDAVDAVVGLSVFSASASVSATGVTSASDAAAHVAAPTLLCLSTADSSSIQEGEADTLVAVGTARAASAVVVRPGGAHGWDMLRDPAVRQRVLDFLKANL
jgi:pimeloyl-ACP methyl ester carboxylesterase